MSLYQIQQLEQLSGIKAHTIRIWEKRYNLLTPLRSETNIRYYDDAQLRKLLMVSTLLFHGYKISKIAELDESELGQLIKELNMAQEESDSLILNFIHQLIGSMISYDEAGFEKIIAAIITRWGMYDAFIKVIYPFLHKTGILWNVIDISPAQEHFASNLIRRKIIAAIDGLPQPSNSDKVFLLLLPPDEWHEIGLQLADYVIRFNGYKTYYLGQNVPLANVKELVKSVSPTHLLTHFVTRKSMEEIKEIVSHYQSTSKNLQLLIAGSEINLKEIKESKRLSKLTSPSQLIELIAKQ